MFTYRVKGEAYLTMAEPISLGRSLFFQGLVDTSGANEKQQEALLVSNRGMTHGNFA
jgi:hypothetical protein